MNPLTSTDTRHTIAAVQLPKSKAVTIPPKKSSMSELLQDIDISVRNVVSVVIPVCNERDNLPALLKRLTVSLQKTPYDFEFIVVDDHSQDGTYEYLERMSETLPLRVFSKKGKPGKSYSVVEGMEEAMGEIIVCIDGDLQYPPEALPFMLAKLDTHDIVVANRKRRRTSFLRTVVSKTFKFFFGRALLGLNVDVQSGLKVWKKEVTAHMRIWPSKWSFDPQLLYGAKRMGYSIGQVDILFEERKAGRSSVGLLRTSLELARVSAGLRLSSLPRDFFPFLVPAHPSIYQSKGFENEDDYLFLPEIHSIKKHIYAETVAGAIAFAALLAAAFILIQHFTKIPPLILVSGFISLAYVGLMCFKIAVVYISLSRKPVNFNRREIQALTDAELPVYTILIPLYKEAEVIGQIKKAMTALDYPVDKLDVIITLEEYDRETIEAIERAKLPPHFKTLILPNVKPKTKPKALNVAFKYTRGEFLVIYDAEIIPDPDQLKKAVLGFRAYPDVACFQTRLDHYNAKQTWITKLFNAEFTFYYDLFLPGLQKLNIPLPLSGHSTHFRRSVLEDIGAWDPYNVTEDCDVGMRLYRRGYKSEILDSLSREEATCTLHAWVLQRTRWLKGFIQTSIVHLRYPIQFKNEIGGWKNFLAFLVVVPGSVLVNLLNLAYWGLLAAWVATHSDVIHQLFPTVILYLSLVSFVVGNFVFTYLNLLASYRRKRFGLVKYSLLSFVYWLMLAYATLRGTIQLFFKPHVWEKTQHGRHITAAA